MTAADVQLPEGAKLASDPQLLIVGITGETADTEDETATPAAPAEPAETASAS